MILLLQFFLFLPGFSQHSSFYILKSGPELTPAQAGVGNPERGMYVFILYGKSYSSDSIKYIVKKEEYLKVGRVDRNNKLQLCKRTENGPRINLYSFEV